MSACTRYPDDDQILRYVASDLDEPELTAFEDHLFDCDTCLARVERYQAAQQVLTNRALPDLPVILAPAGKASGERVTAHVPWWLLGAIAASLVMVAGGVWSWQRSPVATTAPAAEVAARTEPAVTPTPVAPANVRSSAALQVAVLAMVTPPPYLSITTRGEASSARFAEGMQAYTNRDWTSAARLLTTVNTPEARFYQGVADLMRGDATSAATSLEAARNSGAQPYARESLFYLGKAALQHGDVPHAREAFSATRKAGASTAREAERLLASLAEVSAPE
jgi:TolA-binding protein